MTSTAWLPKFLRWIFTFFVVVMALGAVAIVAVMAIDPTLPANAGFGTINVEFAGQPGTIRFQSATFPAIMVNGGLKLTVDNAAGLFDLVKHYGLPVALISVLFCLVLFELLRRLFRNVVRGESFTRETVRLVQILGVSLLAYSVVSALAAGWFQYEVYSFLTKHATIWISGTPTRLPYSDAFSFSSGSGSPVGSPVFFSGLLVLALSEVFRQGLVLKRENDLTV